MDILNLASRYGPAKPISDRDAWEIESMLSAHDIVKGPAHSITGEWLVRKAMTLKGWRSPYAWFRRTNSPGCWNVVSYHHPARLCWSWLLSVTFGRRAGGRWTKPFSRFGGQFMIGLPGLIEFRFHRQSYDYMLSGNAKSLLSLLVRDNAERRAT